MEDFNTILQRAMEYAVSTGKTQFCIGITGHRRNRLTDAESKQATAIFADIFDDIDCRAVLPVRVLSGMADGADISAAAARPQHWSLTMVLALPVSRWGQQLAQTSPADLQQFSRDQADAEVIEVSENTPDYVAVADHVIAQSDLLIALWDGQPGKSGGTGNVVAKAQSNGMPVVHIPYPMTGPYRLLCPPHTMTGNTDRTGA